MVKKLKHNFYDMMDFPQYTFQEFPKVMYGPNGRTITVTNISEQRSLGAEWFADPLKAREAEQAVKEAPKVISAVPEVKLPIGKQSADAGAVAGAAASRLP